MYSSQSEKISVYIKFGHREITENVHILRIGSCKFLILSH